MLFITEYLEITRDNKVQTKEEMPSLESIKELRKNEEAYIFYCMHFLPVLVGKVTWRKALKRNAKVTDVATASDEAMGIAILHNSWDRWVWEHNKMREEIKKCKETKAAQESIFTSNGHGAGSQKHMGWSKEGVRKFNELCKRVMQDRTENGDKFNEAFLQRWREKYTKNGDAGEYDGMETDDKNQEEADNPFIKI